ncbi:MAG: UDP-N-acetylmuramoyl-tripeptide--D-alanyl-D-alanine ligase [Candidatus Zambryskibacteria bacterium]|nr:UDP-N-acetylmuramoyl-tripeptide--D-alanyl-D-alanine ligase [Candidatus Zambryskibacteria bacterium]
MPLLYKDFIKKSLVYLASKVLVTHKPYVIAIIGSVGKTTAREAIYTVLSKKHSVRTSEKSLTTDIGVPLTILGCPYSISTFTGWVQNFSVALRQVFFTKNYPQYVILEIDGQAKGEIARLVEWLSIDMLVVTTIGEIPAHVEHFETPESLRSEYALILKALKEDSKVVVYEDDEYSRSLRSALHLTISYGSSESADISNEDYIVVYEHVKPVGLSFQLKKPALNEAVVVRGTLGMHAVNAILASMAVLQALGEHPYSMNSLFEKMSLPLGRMKILPGIKDSIIFDDSYNSSPVAVEELIAVTKKVNSKRKILVLGDMFELGRFSTQVHREIGRECVGFDMLLCVGVRSRFIKEGALEAGVLPETIFHFDTAEKAGAYLQNILEAGDFVAVKGSQNMRMERCVEEIMLEPLKKEKLLVRQSEEWLGR